MAIWRLEGLGKLKRTNDLIENQTRYLPACGIVPKLTTLPRAPTWTLFFILVCEAIGTAATPGLLCQPRVIVKMIVEKQMECRLAGETEVLGKNLPQRHFCPSQNPT
jgi:hypothetical protein